MRKVEQIGQDRFGAGFSYNLAVFPSGRAYVGCGVSRVGSHTAQRNTRALGVVLMGNYEVNPLGGPALAALVEILRDAKRLGWLESGQFDGGHRDLKQTACPGDYAYQAIPEINRLALSPVQGNLTLGSSPGPTDALEGSMLRLIYRPDGRQYLIGIGVWDYLESMAKVGALRKVFGLSAATAVTEAEYADLREVMLKTAHDA